MTEYLLYEAHEGMPPPRGKARVSGLVYPRPHEPQLVRVKLYQVPFSLTEVPEADFFFADVLQYLYTTKHVQLTLTGNLRTDLEIYTDASYGGEQARSQTGVLVMFNGNIVNWYTRRHDVVALSITEAEYIAA